MTEWEELCDKCAFKWMKIHTNEKSMCYKCNGRELYTHESKMLLYHKVLRYISASVFRAQLGKGYNISITRIEKIIKEHSMGFCKAPTCPNNSIKELAMKIGKYAVSKGLVDKINKERDHVLASRKIERMVNAHCWEHCDIQYVDGMKVHKCRKSIMVTIKDSKKEITCNLMERHSGEHRSGLLPDEGFVMFWNKGLENIDL